MFLSAATRHEKQEAAARISYTRLAVWGEPEDVKRVIKNLDGA